MNYLELEILVSNSFAEILIAELAEIGYDTFEENPQGFKAYLPENLFDEKAIKSLKESYKAVFSFDYAFKKIPKQNWNSVWETSYQPILVEDKCYIRAHFHPPKKEIPFEIIITPKMSFGTGHHQTTELMIRQMFELNFENKSVLDMGCGTGILAILAAKMKAKKIVGIDIEDWAVENSIENAEKNQIQNIDFILGDGSKINGKFDIILANINKNIILQDFKRYDKALNPSGVLLLSGFFESDIPTIEQLAKKHNLEITKKLQKDSWVTLRLKKIIMSR